MLLQPTNRFKKWRTTGTMDDIVIAHHVYVGWTKKWVLWVCGELPNNDSVPVQSYGCKEHANVRNYIWVVGVAPPGNYVTYLHSTLTCLNRVHYGYACTYVAYVHAYAVCGMVMHVLTWRIYMPTQCAVWLCMYLRGVFTCLHSVRYGYACTYVAYVHAYALYSTVGHVITC